MQHNPQQPPRWCNRPGCAPDIESGPARQQWGREQFTQAPRIQTSNASPAPSTGIANASGACRNAMGPPPEHGHTREHPPRNLPGKLDSATPTQQDPKSHKFCTSQPRERSWPLVRLPTAGATMAPRDMPPTTRRPMNMELEPVTRPYGSRTGPRMQSHADAGVVAEGLSKELGGAPNREVDRRHHKLGRGRASDRQKRWERGHAWIHPVCLRNASPNALRRSALCPNESGG